ncbi:MAG: lysophospholipid acyltransferase family protein [Lachnospiraceae bacterium]
MIRLIFFLLYALIVIILSPFLFLFIHLFWRNKQEKIDNFSQKFVRTVFRQVLFIIGVKATVLGTENIPEDEAVLFVGNHRSDFDILVPYLYFKTPTGYIAKKELDKIPILRTWMRNIHCLFLDRTSPKEGLKTILAGIENVKNGYSVAIFPEGTRAKTDEMLPFKQGSLKIADKSGCKIIPMAQSNTSAIFEDHKPFFKKTHMVLEFGKPIVLSELSPEDRKASGAYTQRIIQEMLDKNKSLV